MNIGVSDICQRTITKMFGFFDAHSKDAGERGKGVGLESFFKICKTPVTDLLESLVLCPVKLLVADRSGKVVERHTMAPVSI